MTHYRVFARINKGDDTLDIGGIEAPTDRLARVYAYEMYDEEDWDYLAVVPRDHLIEVPEEGQVPDAARTDAAGGGR